jgi:hypothetical protein
MDLSKKTNNMYDEYNHYDYLFHHTIKYIVGIYVLRENNKDKYVSGFIINYDDFDNMEYFERYMKRFHKKHYNKNRYSELYETINNIDNITIKVMKSKIIKKNKNFDYHNIKDYLNEVIKFEYKHLKLNSIDAFNMDDMLIALEEDLIDNTFEENCMINW